MARKPPVSMVVSHSKGSLIMPRQLALLLFCLSSLVLAEEAVKPKGPLAYPKAAVVLNYEGAGSIVPVAKNVGEDAEGRTIFKGVASLRDIACAYYEHLARREVPVNDGKVYKPVDVYLINYRKEEENWVNKVVIYSGGDLTVVSDGQVTVQIRPYEEPKPRDFRPRLPTPWLDPVAGLPDNQKWKGSDGVDFSVYSSTNKDKTAEIGLYLGNHPQIWKIEPNSKKNGMLFKKPVVWSQASGKYASEKHKYTYVCNTAYSPGKDYGAVCVQLWAMANTLEEVEAIIAKTIDLKLSVRKNK